MTGFSPDFQSDLWSLIRMRRDVRRFKPDAIDPEIVDRCLRSFSLASSVGLSEP